MARKPHKISVRKGLKINPRSKLPNKALGKKILKDIDSIPNEQPRQPHQKAKAIKAVKNVKAGFGEAKRRKKTLARRPAVKALTKKKQGVSLLRKGDTEKHIQHLLRTAKQKDAKKEKRRKGRAKTVKAATKAARTAKQNLKKITALSGDKLKARRKKLKAKKLVMGSYKDAVKTIRASQKTRKKIIKKKQPARRAEVKAATKAAHKAKVKKYQVEEKRRSKTKRTPARAKDVKQTMKEKRAEAEKAARKRRVEKRLGRPLGTTGTPSPEAQTKLADKRAKQGRLERVVARKAKKPGKPLYAPFRSTRKQQRVNVQKAQKRAKAKTRSLMKGPVARGIGKAAKYAARGSGVGTAATVVYELGQAADKATTPAMRKRIAAANAKQKARRARAKAQAKKKGFTLGLTTKRKKKGKK